MWCFGKHLWASVGFNNDSMFGILLHWEYLIIAVLHVYAHRNSCIIFQSVMLLLRLLGMTNATSHTIHITEKRLPQHKHQPVYRWYSSISYFAFFSPSFEFTSIASPEYIIGIVIFLSPNFTFIYDKTRTKLHPSKQNTANITKRFSSFFSFFSYILLNARPRFGSMFFHLLFFVRQIQFFCHSFPVSIILFGAAWCCWRWCVSLFHFIFVPYCMRDGCYLWEL